MQQLSGLDAMFVYAEEPAAPLHISLLYVYEPGPWESTRARFDGLYRHIRRRLHTSRIYRRKLAGVPLHLDHPYWIEDKDFDLGYHVHHEALPRPGNWSQLCFEAARLHARPMDLDKPLWEMHIIDGLDAIEKFPPGAFALMAKIHHAAIDGVAGSEITMDLHDLRPVPKRVRRQPWRGEEPPGLLKLLLRSGVNNFTGLVRTGVDVMTTLPGVARIIIDQIGDLGEELFFTPRTRFDEPVSSERVFDARDFDLDRLREIKNAVPGATINDVVITICGGAFRKYLLAHDELPRESLVTAAPISTRLESELGDAGNQVTAMRVSMCTDIGDPLDRLEAVYRATSASKEMVSAVGARHMTDLNKHVPAATMSLVSRLLSSPRFARHIMGTFNTIVTNVTGPQQPLYLDGARLLHFSGLGPLAHGNGLFFGVISYDGTLVIAITADRRKLPDSDFMSACLQEAYEELRAASAGHGRRIAAAVD